MGVLTVGSAVVDEQNRKPSRPEYCSCRQTAWAGTRSTGSREVQISQVGEVAQLRRYLPAQLVLVEAQ